MDIKSDVFVLLMATAFAITGIHRSRLKHYRPTYHSELPPIYEDPTTLLRHELAGAAGREYIHSSRHGKLGNGNVGFVHDYEEIDTVHMNDNKEIRPIANPSETSVSMLNGLMKSISRFKSNGIKSRSGDYLSEIVHTGSNGEMLNGMMHSRLKSVNNSEGFDGKPLSENDGNHPGDQKYCNIDTASRTGVQYTKDALPVLEQLDKALDLQDEELSKEVSEAITRERTSLSSLYKVKDGDYGVVTDVNGFAVNRWPKLEPEPPKRKYFLCPAERKMRRRCFILCFVILVLLIGVFLIGIVEGWLYTKSGTGFDGSKTTLFTMQEVNRTDGES